jgi:tetratricopeptide (TPR) repeat protein
MNTSPQKSKLRTLLVAAIATTLTASVVIGISGTASAGETPTADNTPRFTVEQSGKRVVNNGVTAYNKGNFSKAAAFNRDALHQGLRTSHMTVVYSNQCATLASQGLYERALEACDEALELTPNNWQAFSNRAAVNWLKGDKTQAKLDINSAKAIDGSATAITHNINVFG